MSTDTLLLVLYIGLWVVFAAISIGLVRRWISRQAFTIYALCAVLVAITVSLHGLTIFRTNTNLDGFFYWYFNVNSEFALGATLSSALLMGAAGAALANSFLVPHQNLFQRSYWFIISGFFLFLSLDEYYTLHEQLFTITGTWQLIYIGLGAFIVLLSLAFWWLYFRDEWRHFGLFVFGFGVMGGAGVILDFVFQEVLCRMPRYGIRCGDFNMIEEAAESLGATLIFAVLLSFAFSQFQKVNWRGFFGITVAALWSIFLLASIWVLPTIEAQFAFPTNMQYLNGRVTLVSFDLNTNKIQPDGRLILTTYWRANEWLDVDYTRKAVLLSNPEFDGVAQNNFGLSDLRPSDAWIPNVIQRQRHVIPIPKDIVTPASYYVSMRIWDINSPTKEEVTGDLRIIAGDTVILALVTAPDASSVPSPSSPVIYQFNDSFRLTGYDLPDAVPHGSNINMSFWWSVQEDIDTSYTQFIHWIDERTGEFYGLDQRPFDGRLPTNTWLSGMQMLDTWSYPASELPIGTYRVQLGFYDDTVTRVPVFDANGMPMQDSIISLGTMTITDDE